MPLLVLSAIRMCCAVDRWSESMDRFIRRENVKHFRELLKTAKTEAERKRIEELLAQEIQKQKDAGDNIDEN